MVTWSATTLSTKPMPPAGLPSPEPPYLFGEEALKPLWVCQAFCSHK